MSNLSYELYLAAKQEIVVARMELASTRKELEDLRVLHKIAWTNEKKLTEELEALTGKMRRLSDKWNDESNEMAIQLSTEIKQKVELRSKCNTLRRCCNELCAAVKSRGN